MEKRSFLGVLITAGLFIAGVVQAVSPQPEEFRLRDEWLGRASLAGAKLDNPPFSFTYDGKPSGELLKNWQTKRATQKLDPMRTEHTTFYTDPATGLQIRCVAIEYGDFPTVEWTLYFKNTGSADTPIIEKIQVLDIALSRGRRRGIPAAPQRWLARQRQRLWSAPDTAGPQSHEAPGRQGRSPDQCGLVLLQPRMARHGADRGRGLAGAVGGRVGARRGAWLAPASRSGTDAVQTSARRGGPQSVDRSAILERRLDRCAEPLAALDDGPLHACAWRHGCPSRNWRPPAHASTTR